jgi:mannose-6-phosphate isomerase-like protein (cupin superfamily)
MPRRVVTGLDGEGRSTVLYDDQPPFVGNPHWPGVGVTLLWKTGAPGADPVGADQPFAIEPPAGGATFLIVRMPPDSELDAMTPEQRALARDPGTMMRDADLGEAGMHATASVEYTVMLEGEVTLVLEDGEVTLKAGDTLINRGVVHAWRNRGTMTAVKAVVMMNSLSRSGEGGACAVGVGG